MDIQNRYNNLCRSIENECVDEEEYGKRITEQEILAESSRIEQEIKINEYEYENQNQNTIRADLSTHFDPHAGIYQ